MFSKNSFVFLSLSLLFISFVWFLLLPIQIFYHCHCPLIKIGLSLSLNTTTTRNCFLANTFCILFLLSLFQYFFLLREFFVFFTKRLSELVSIFFPQFSDLYFFRLLYSNFFRLFTLIFLVHFRFLPVSLYILSIFETKLFFPNPAI